MVQGLKSLNRKLTRSIPNRVREAAADKLEDRAKLIVAEMKRRAPERDGDLVSSINWTWGDAPAGSFVMGAVAGQEYGTMRITIYAGDESTIVTNSRGVPFQNAFLQEFGTSDMPPTPYFYPTWRQQRRGSKSSITRAINKAIKDGAR